jgi:opacity protein-like surface antigen
MMSRPISSLFLMAIGLIAVSSVSEAQESRIHWHIMGGYSETLGTTADFLQGGYLLGGGFSIAPMPYIPLDLRFDLAYSEHNASNRLVSMGQQTTPVRIDGGTGSFWSASGNLVYYVPVGYAVRGYGIAGIGAYHTRVELTQAVPFFGDFNCDPFSGFCDGGVGVADALVAAHDVTKFGWNVGVGVEFARLYGQSWFIEARYHRISTPTPIEYLPLEVGLRF